MSGNTKLRTISARRAIAGDLAVVLAAVLGALVVTLYIAGLPLQLGAPAAAAGLVAAAVRLAGIRDV
jgi:hypothetical protein